MQYSGVGRRLAVGGLRNGEGARGAPPINKKINITYGFSFFHPFGLKEVLRCALCILAKLIDGIK